MKNIFGINITDSKHNTETDGCVFISRQVTSYQRDRIDDFYNRIRMFDKQSGLPLPLDIFMTACAGLGTIILISDLKILLNPNDISIGEAYHNAPYLFYIEAICWIIFFILLAVKKYRTHKVLKSREFSDFSEGIDDIFDESSYQLKIPENPEEIDVLLFRYKIKNGKEKRIPFHGGYYYENFSKCTYIQNNCLCLADEYKVIEIPLESIKSITKMKKRASFCSWNKDEDYDSEKYKPFKITRDNNGIYYTKYYAVHIQDIKGGFELFIPDYDINSFMEITHMHTE